MKYLACLLLALTCSCANSTSIVFEGYPKGCKKLSEMQLRSNDGSTDVFGLMIACPAKAPHNRKVQKGSPQ